MGNETLFNSGGSLNGTIRVPGDKSISHRSIMFGAISHGKTVIENFLFGEDCISTIDCFRKLGVDIEVGEQRIEVNGKGFEGLQEPTEILDVGNSGTTTRLMMGILASMPFHSVIIGDESIARRPMSRVTKPLISMGAKIDGRAEGDFTPISIRGGALQAIDYALPVGSAQVKSAILLAALQSEGKTVVREPAVTRDHTERMIRLFGGNVETNENIISIQGCQTLKGTHITVPGDISSAAFFLVGAAITKNSSIKLEHVGLNPTRTGIVDVLEMMGADFDIEYDTADEGTEPIGAITIRASDLKGTVIEGELIPRLIDEIPVIALLATQAEGTTIIRDAEELKVKETNRIDSVVNELKKMGADIEATPDGMIIRGKCGLKGAEVDSHGDHRIGMMLAIASLICQGNMELKGKEAIRVSYPQFFEHMNELTD
ncbi:3-phosphoshikimate 1-carboxyvinyltransferase [Falsibacillus pallidus]|uniref:3-phosphoshikimate 1-carboxyvinyltransferase n=1 Tax=Falsibacillus pallidus TaxID=493781 RepID=A0A370GGS7_9BACI|nr:3-phosphoshikimate 1-carboxyvinyltransferase [Falsibacillus pallidus]RDI42998.1 3-phosphoshikimate 1-carboxyvinyltransferase [Falsibacillus pallidus]